MKKQQTNNEKISQDVTQENAPVKSQTNDETTLQELQRDILTLAKCLKSLTMQFDNSFRSDPGILSIKQDLSELIYRYEKLKEK